MNQAPLLNASLPQGGAVVNSVTAPGSSSAQGGQNLPSSASFTPQKSNALQRLFSAHKGKWLTVASISILATAYWYLKKDKKLAPAAS